MKRAGTISIVAAVALMLALVVAAEDKPWFDMDNCDFCKHLMTDPGLMENMTWEHYSISNGLITITTVEDKYMEAYNKANAAMEEMAKKMEKGEEVKMCGSCMEYGALMQAGVKFEHLKTMHGHVTVMTSDKPELVAKIQAWGKRNMDEMEKMAQKEQGEK